MEGAEEIKEYEEAVQVKISDTSQMQFEIVVPKSLMPDCVAVGDVIRIKSVVASTQ